MTTVAHEPDQVDIEELNRARQRNRILGTVVVVLAVAILALGAWLIYGLATDTETTATAEIDQVLTDYRTAADETDLDAFRAIVTDDFVVTFSIHRQVGDLFLMDSDSETLDEISARSLVPYDLDSTGEPIVAGEGPWTVSVAETWNTTHEQWVGTATYVIVEQDEGLKIASVNRVTVIEDL